MNCALCHGEINPLPAVSLLLGHELAGEFCSILCLVKWCMTHGLAVREFDVTLCSQCVAAIVGAIESVARR